MIGLMRVKNEERWISRAIASLQRCCERVVVMDDESTDATVEIAHSLKADVLPSPFTTLDEARDKSWLVAQCYDRGWLRAGERVLMIDGDEELVEGDEARIHDALDRWPCAALRILYLWDDENHVRMDGVYGRFWRPSAWIAEGREFDGFIGLAANGSGFHCSNAPARIANRSMRTEARLLHYGYMHRADRIRKYEWYNSRDPGNQFEDCYRHTVIGDLFPPQSRFVHAGPLEVRPWRPAA